MSKHLFIIALMLSLINCVSGCSTLYGNDPRNVVGMMNPKKIHDRNSSDVRIKSAAAIPVDDYYNALTLAHSPYTEGKIPTQNQSNIDNYVKEGVGLVNTYCRQWFRNLSDAQRAYARGKSDFNVIQQLGTALIGVTGASSIVTAVYGATNTAISGLAENYSDAYLVTPTTNNVENRIFEALEAREVEITAKNKFTHFKDAYNALEEYAAICTYSKAQLIVDSFTSDEEKKVEIKPSGAIKISASATILQAQESSRVDTLHKSIIALTDQEAIVLTSNPPVDITDDLTKVINLVDPENRRASNGGAARKILDMLLVYTTKNEDQIKAWEKTLLKQ